jgi:hypothetical protein
MEPGRSNDLVGSIHPPPAPYWDGERINDLRPRHWRTGRQGRPRSLPFVDEEVFSCDFRDAKAMAHALRDALKNRSIETTHSEALELVAKAFGYDNWNILSAKIEAATARFDREHAVTAAAAAQGSTPPRDAVVLVLRQEPARRAQTDCGAVGLYLR